MLTAFGPALCDIASFAISKANLARGSMRPFVVINASVLSTGARFPFTQGQFDLLCSDPGSVSVGRAVAASAALPPYFSAITLTSYAGTCGLPVAPLTP